MSGYIKYFENGGKNMSFMIKYDKVWDKYDKIWEVIKDKLGINFHSKPVYEYRYLKAKVREFDGMIQTIFWGNNMPKENLHYTCIACMITENHPQVYLEECKYNVNGIRIPKFINAELKSDSESDLDSDLEKIETKIDNELKSSSDSE